MNSSKYSLDKELSKHIQEQLKVTPELIERARKFFLSVKENETHGFEEQYLAHIQRSLEGIIREKIGNPFFKISLRKLPEDDPGFKVGTAKYVKNRFFTVYYHPQMDKKQLRVCLAHELGHLYIAALQGKDKSDLENFSSEPRSTLFGIFCILDKDDFYANQARSYCHVSSKAIVDSFVQMANRVSGIAHSSQARPSTH